VAGLLVVEDKRRKEARRRENSDCAGRQRASPLPAPAATTASSAVQHLVADASTGLHGLGILFDHASSDRERGRKEKEELAGELEMEEEYLQLL
jgi:hypothetical protein